MQQNKQAVPYKVESENPERQYEILENGDVKMNEVIRSTVYFSGREFITFIRQHEDIVEDLKQKLSDEARQENEDNLKDSLENLDLIKPMQEQVEAKLKEKYERDRFDGLKNGLKSLLSAEKVNEQQLVILWNNFKQEEKEKLNSELTKEEKEKIVLAIAKMKRKKI